LTWLAISGRPYAAALQASEKKSQEEREQIDTVTAERADIQAGPGRCCPPRQASRLEPSFLEFLGIP